MPFTQFIDWPEEGFAGKEAPLVLAVLGLDPFGPFPDRVVRAKKEREHAKLLRLADIVASARDGTWISPPSLRVPP